MTGRCPLPTIANKGITEKRNQKLKANEMKSWCYSSTIIVSAHLSEKVMTELVGRFYKFSSLSEASTGGVPWKKIFL